VRNLSKSVSLFEYPRGLLWDFVSDRTGLNNLNLIESNYLINTKILQYTDDFSYLISNVHARKCAEKIKDVNEQLFVESDAIIKDLGIKETKQYGFDTYYGTLINYSWHKGIAEQGSGYSPVYHLINELKIKYPKEIQKLDSIYRRIVYLEVITDEFQYLRDKYDYNQIPILLEWTTNKFETFAAVLTEMTLLIIEFYYRIHSKLNPLQKNQCKFEEIFNLTKDQSSFFNSVNHALYSLLAVELRNEITHGCGYNLIQKNGGIFFTFEIDLTTKFQQYSVLKDWINNRIIGRFSGKKTPNIWYDFKDPCFNFTSWKIRFKKQGGFEVDNSRIVFDIELKEYIDLMIKVFFYHLCDKLFRNLLKE